MTAAADRFAYALGRLRHLYAQMIDGRVKNTVEAASGLLGPAIADLEVETGEVSAEVERLSRELQEAVGGEPAPGVLTRGEIDAVRDYANIDLARFSVKESVGFNGEWEKSQWTKARDIALATLALLSDHAKLEREFVALKKHSDVVDERLEAVTKERDALRAKYEPPPPPLPVGCNKHINCEQAESEAQHAGKPERYGPGSQRLSHCHDEDCEDCFGR